MELISKLQQGVDLSYSDTGYMLSQILSGRTTDIQNTEFLFHLTKKGETDQEISSMLDVMQEYSLKLVKEGEQEDKEDAIKEMIEHSVDMCGTGGDNLSTFNVSTAASFVVASLGVTVPKHGNRSSSGLLCGSADVFEYFGYDLDQETRSLLQMLSKFNICFLFAQKFHPAMKNMAKARRKIARKTVFNILGPLSNPARIKNQVIGVYSSDLVERIPRIIKSRENDDACLKKSSHVMTVRSENGMDELTTSAPNITCTLKENKISKGIIKAESFNLHHSSLRDIQVKTKQQSIKSFVSVLNNTANQAMIETTALNAAAGLIVSGVAKDFDQGVDMALNAILNEKPYKLFKEFIQEYGDLSKLKEVQET